MPIGTYRAGTTCNVPIGTYRAGNDVQRADRYVPHMAMEWEMETVGSVIVV